MREELARVVRGLATESARLSTAVRDGRLDVRADAAGTTAEFRPVVEGMNDVVDAFVRPVKLAADSRLFARPAWR